MNLAALSVAALFFTILLSCVTRLNVGIVAFAMAWIIGVYFGGFTAEQVASGFPVSLFITLVGMTLLFSQAQLNGTLDKLAQTAVRACRGNRGVIPVMFFVISAILASAGPGNIATAALMAPMAMSIAGRAGIPAFLMAIMVGNGANAGSLSPFAPTGIIANGVMHKIGLAGHEWQSYTANLAAHSLVAFSGFFAFGGWRLFTRPGPQVPCPVSDDPEPLTRAQWITLAAIASLLAGVLILRMNTGMAAFAAAGVLALLKAADDAESIRKVPWNVIVMVSGVTVLIALLERTQGLALFTGLLARLATKESATAAIAFITGLVSVYSSTSGVVLPAFLPTAPGLAAQLGGVDPVAIAMSINIGSHLVDVSPLSTIGALCVASAPADVDARKLFNALLAWGMLMTVAGAALCYVFFRQ